MKDKTYAPVIIPTLNRYDHFHKCLESLEKCTGADETEVFVGLDYPPSERYVEGWRKIDSYLQEKEKNNGFKKLVIFRRKYNYGIKGDTSNVAVLSRFIRQNYEKYIFTEDDNVFSPNFLLYMNSCLDAYGDNLDVIAVTGYSYPIDWKRSDGATVQKQNFNASAWGWGLWTAKRKVLSENISSGDMYNRAPKVLKRKDYKKGLFVAFYEYMCAAIIPIALFKKVQSGRLTITDYCTRQYLFVYDKKVISPLVSKVRNIGLDGSGAYCQNNNAAVCDDKTSWTTDFTNQKIDDSDTFEIVENSPALLEQNRALLDKYEWRPFNQHIIANAIAFGIRICGLKFMRAFTSLAFKIWHRRVN